MSKIIDTGTIPHRKFTIPLPWNKKSPMRVTYYIGGIKEKGIRGYYEFQIHEKISGNDLGYCGSVLDFLMEDGTIEKVKGPFYKSSGENSEILYEILIALER